MKPTLFLAGLVTTSLAFAAATWAADSTTAPADTQPATIAATTSAPATLPAFASNDNAGLLAQAGKIVAVTGRVDRVSATATGSITFIDFTGNERGDFVAIIKEASLDAINKGFDGDVAKALAGKKITVTGKVTKYHNGAQIEVTKPEQLTIIKE